MDFPLLERAAGASRGTDYKELMALPPSLSGYRGNAQQVWLFRSIPCLDGSLRLEKEPLQFQDHSRSSPRLSKISYRMVRVSLSRNKHTCSRQLRFWWLYSTSLHHTTAPNGWKEI